MLAATGLVLGVLLGASLDTSVGFVLGCTESNISMLLNLEGMLLSKLLGRLLGGELANVLGTEDSLGMLSADGSRLGIGVG